MVSVEEPMKVLLFEDSEDITRIVSLKLASANYFLQSYASCSENVCELVLKHSPDLILLDLDLPGIGGKKAAELLKSNVLCKDTPLVIFSADPEAPAIANMVRAEGIISKPFNLSTFVKDLERIARSKVANGMLEY